jgi:hypothetical protein
MACLPGRLRGGRSLRDLYTPSGGAPFGREEKVCADWRVDCGVAGIHATKWPQANTSKGRIMSFDSCSRMWQW